MFSLKANIRAQEEREKKREEKPAIKLKIGPVRPRRNALNFHEPGKFVAEAEERRKAARREELRRRIELRGQQTGIIKTAKLATLTVPTRQEEAQNESIPDVEWWDSQLIAPCKTLDEVYEKLQKPGVNFEALFNGITHLVEHPIPIKPPIQRNKVVVMPGFLTTKERKKLRRQNRREAWKEAQEKIRLGFEPPPEPKLKLSNMMLALGQKAVQDPSKVEATVREQMAARQRAHEEHNARKKLTVEQKRAKKAKKFQDDLSVTGVWVSVYRVNDLSFKAHRFKIDKNAKQLMMTGIMLLCPSLNVVIVEGGPKQQEKFKKLMLNRIKWSESGYQIAGDIKKEDNNENKCVLVWNGQVKKKSFVDMKIKQVQNFEAARDFLKELNIEHYWDLSYKSSVLDSIDFIK